MLARSRIYTNSSDEKCDCVTQHCDYSVTGWRNVLTLMTLLCNRFIFILLKKANLTQTLNVGINSPTTENAYTETRK